MRFSAQVIAGVLMIVATCRFAVAQTPSPTPNPTPTASPTATPTEYVQDGEIRTLGELIIKVPWSDFPPDEAFRLRDLLRRAKIVGLDVETRLDDLDRQDTDAQRRIDQANVKVMEITEGKMLMSKMRPRMKAEADRLAATLPTPTYQPTATKQPTPTPSPTVTPTPTITPSPTRTP